MNNNYIVKAKVDQIVTKEIYLSVSATSEEEAEKHSREVLADYPRPVDNLNVLRIVTDKANYWIPRSIDIVSVKEGKKKNG